MCPSCLSRDVGSSQSVLGLPHTGGRGNPTGTLGCPHTQICQPCLLGTQQLAQETALTLFSPLFCPDSAGKAAEWDSPELLGAKETVSGEDPGSLLGIGHHQAPGETEPRVLPWERTELGPSLARSSPLSTRQLVTKKPKSMALGLRSWTWADTLGFGMQEVWGPGWASVSAVPTVPGAVTQILVPRNPSPSLPHSLPLGSLCLADGPEQGS